MISTEPKFYKKNGGPGESRTPDKRFRKPLLYPSELQALGVFYRIQANCVENRKWNLQEA